MGFRVAPANEINAASDSCMVLEQLTADSYSITSSCCFAPATAFSEYGSLNV